MPLNQLHADSTSVDQTLNKIQAYYLRTERNFLAQIGTQPKANKLNTGITDHIQLEGENIKAWLKQTNIFVIATQRIPVLFDISRSINTNLSHSGISKFMLILYRTASAN